MKTNKFILPGIILTLVLFAMFLSNKNKKEIDKNGIETIVRIVEIIDKRKGITTSEKVARVIYSTFEGQIENRVPFQANMEVNKCYEMKYLKENVRVVSINDLKEKDCE